MENPKVFAFSGHKGHNCFLDVCIGSKPMHESHDEDVGSKGRERSTYLNIKYISNYDDDGDDDDAGDHLMKMHI